MKNGFTLIEVLVYIVVLAMAIGGMTLVAVNIFEISARTSAVQEVAHNGRFAMHKINYEIKNASSIVSPETEGDTLELLSDEVSVVFQVIENEEENEKKLTIERDGISYDLTTSRVQIDALKFTKLSDDSIKVEMNISHSNPQNLPVQEFSNFFIGSFSKSE